MIGWLCGTLQYFREDTFILNVSGVGYEVVVTASVLAEDYSLDDEVSLVIYTDVRENDISLFGFSSQMEKQVFLLLKKVKGVGSKLARSIISSLGAEPLLLAIGQEDIGALKNTPGVGKKTAERIIVELREQVSQMAEGATASLRSQIETSTIASSTPSVEEDAVLALEKLGFSTDRAKASVAEACAALSAAETDSASVLRKALSLL